MGEEFAIIATFEDGTRSVYFVQGTKERALKSALIIWRMVRPENVTIARVCGYVFDENDFSIY